MPTSIDSLLAAIIERPADRHSVSRALAALLPIWRSTYPGEIQGYPGDRHQHYVGVAAIKVAEYSWRSAIRLLSLVPNSYWRSQMRYECEIKRAQAGLRMVRFAPEKAIRLAEAVRQPAREIALLDVARELFPFDRPRSLQLFRQCCNQPMAAKAYLISIASHDWHTATTLAQSHGLIRDDSFILQLISFVARGDLLFAEQLVAQMTDTTSKSYAIRDLLKEYRIETVPECLRLMDRPPYSHCRIPVFVHCTALIREYCGLPPQAAQVSKRSEWEDSFWEKFRAILRRVEIDLAWALDEVRQEPDPEKREYIFGYLNLEFCHAR